jgi:hypothetical protein
MTVIIEIDLFQLRLMMSARQSTTLYKYPPHSHAWLSDDPPIIYVRDIARGATYHSREHPS